MAKIYYPAVFHKENNDTYWVEFPDLPGCLTQGKSFNDALCMADDVLGEWLNSKEFFQVDHFDEPTELGKIMKRYPGELVSMVEYDDVSWKKEHAKVSIHKTVSLPQWLYELASEKGISLSKTLQKALKDELGIN